VTESEPEPPAVLGSVLEGTGIDDPSARVALLKIDAAPRWLQSGGTLVIDLPKRLVCASCEGGGCSRCDNSGGYRLADDSARPPLRINMASSRADGMRVRVASKELDEVDVVVVQISSREPPSRFVRHEPCSPILLRPAPTPSMSATGIIATVIALTAMLITIAIALLMRS
jgi:hypothetical protein